MEIRVLIDNSPGTMARVVTTLRRMGMAIEGQRLVDSDQPDCNELVIEADGLASADELSRDLGEIKGAVKVLGVGGSGRQSTGRAKADNNQVRGNIVDQIVAAYPKILRYVDAFEQDITNPDERTRRLITLGEQVGGRMMRGKTELDGCDSLREALAVVVPILKPIADARAVGSEIHTQISIFTRRQVNTMDLVFGSEATKCDFMTGFIQGIVNSAPTLPRIGVKETACRTNGDEECIFQLT